MSSNAAADVHDLLAVDAQVAEIQGRLEVLGRDVVGEVVGEFGGGEADGDLLRGLHTEEVADVPAAVEGLGELADPVEGVAAVQERGDRAQPVQVRLVVPGDTTLAAGRLDEPAFTVEAHGADRDTGRLRQLLHAVLVLLSVSRLILCHAGNLMPYRR